MILDVAAVGEGGLLGIALDPQFESNHFVYAAYTFRDISGSLKNQLVRLREDPVTVKGIMDKVLLVGDGGSNHDGGRVKFGPDGKIYWTLGDAGNADRTQDLSSLNGKILRLNPDGTIPADNPFSNSPVYSYGHRNPEGIAWQPETGRLFETEHGSSATDEVNYIEPGKNYGWPVIRGDQAKEGMVSPVLQSDSDTWAPSGATFITGGPWDGSFLFTGLRGQSLYKIALNTADPVQILFFERLFENQFGRLRNVIQGPDGAIYILTNNTDGRGHPRSGDDRILKLIFE
jgi:glucose/arabinose dehydrogenase